MKKVYIYWSSPFAAHELDKFELKNTSQFNIGVINRSVEQRHRNITIIHCLT